MIDLLPFTEADIDRVLPWITSREDLYLWTAWSFGFPLTRDHLLQHMRESAERGDRLLYKAINPEDQTVFGHVELGAIDLRNRSLRIGRVLIDPACRGRGLGDAMMRAAVALAFEQFGMHRVELWVFENNPRAVACYERVGFKREGVARDWFKSDDGYWNMIIMSILEPEWAALRSIS
jgi:RimJ/RimL family protein N-acetyltransferase